MLQISQANNFSKDNIFQIPKDSYIYLKQLLKTSSTIETSYVRPFIIILYLLSRFDYLTLEEFTYLLPLCIDPNSTANIIENIEKLRRRETSVDEVIIEHLMSFQNYNDGLNQFLNNQTISQSLICEIGMNRKQKRYDKPYYNLYKKLHKVFVENEIVNLYEVFEATAKITITNQWRTHLFDTRSLKAIKEDPIEHLKATLFTDVTNEKEFREAFFKTLHLLKAKALLADYMDLNRRYVKTSDIILFEDDMVKMDIIPKHILSAHIDKLYKQAYEKCVLLEADCELTDIFEGLYYDEQGIIDGINRDMSTSVSTIDEARNIVEKERYRRLQHLIETKFEDGKLLKLLECFENRNDNEIRMMVTENADVPTIFEYILAIIWYKVSEGKGKILDYMQLSLDADLLPKSHAIGGEADIVYQYPESENHPSHTLLIEATLADGTNQRRMEMEPVSRHLGQHLLKTNDAHSYCVFITTFLHINVLSDFRSRKTYIYYDASDYNHKVSGMKIIPIKTNDLKTIVIKGIKYKDLYNIFESAHESSLEPHEWYDACISSPLTLDP